MTCIPCDAQVSHAFDQLDQKVAAIHFNGERQCLRMYNTIQPGTPLKCCDNAKHGTPPKQPCDPCHAEGKSSLLESPKIESNVGTGGPSAKKTECQLLVAEVSTKARKHAGPHAQTRAYAPWSKRVRSSTQGANEAKIRRPGRRAQYFVLPPKTMQTIPKIQHPQSKIQSQPGNPKSKIENLKPQKNIKISKIVKIPKIYKILNSLIFQNRKNFRIIQT